MLRFRLRHEVPVWSSHFGKPAFFKLKSTSTPCLCCPLITCIALPLLLVSRLCSCLLGLRLCRSVRRYRPISRLPRKQRAVMMPPKKTRAKRIGDSAHSGGERSGQREMRVISDELIFALGAVQRAPVAGGVQPRRDAHHAHAAAY
jgi:hypothetical protein